MPIDLADYRKRAHNHKWDGTTGRWSCEADMDALLDEVDAVVQLLRRLTGACDFNYQDGVSWGNALRGGDVGDMALMKEVDARITLSVRKESVDGSLTEDELRGALQKANYDYWAVTHPTMGVAANPYKEGIVIVDDLPEGDS